MPASMLRRRLPFSSRLAKQVGHLPLDRVEALVEASSTDDWVAAGSSEKPAVSAGRALREDSPLHLVDLPLEPVDALLGSRLLALRERGRGQAAQWRRSAAKAVIGRDNLTGIFPTLPFGSRLCPPAALPAR